MKYFVEFVTVILCLLLFCSAAFCQQLDSGKEEGPIEAAKTALGPIRPTALPDGNQSPTLEGEFISSGTNVDLREDLKVTPISRNPNAALWRGLSQLSLSEKENALLDLRVQGDLPPSAKREVDSVQILWNSGNHDQAIARLCNLEASEGWPGALVGITWMRPMPVIHPEWGTDYRIGSRTGMQKTCLDFDYGTTNLFALTKFYDGEYWAVTVNFSSDSGQTWSERFWLWGPNPINDVSGAVLYGFFYMGVTVGWNEDVAIYRFFVSNGNQDYDYSPQNVIEGGYEVLDIALTSNADFFDNRIYLLAILESDSLIYMWSDRDALVWNDIPTYIADADHGLDACCNQDYSDWFLFVSYVDKHDTVSVARKSSAEWQNIKLDQAVDVTSVAAYQDRIITAYEHTYTNGRGIKYYISYNGGDNWYWGSLAEPSPGQQYFTPDVAARRGGGMAVVYGEEVGEPDPCWYRHRDYGTGPGTATWSDPEQFNEIDLTTGLPMALEWVPPPPPYCHAFGSIWIGGDERGAYFDKNGYLLAADPNGDGVINVNDAIYILNYLFRGGPAPDPLESGDANCNGDVDVTDAIYILNYLFREGDPPDCCP